MKLKKILAIMLAFILVATLIGCENKYNVEQEKGVAGFTYVYPEKISGALHNPGTGWVSLEEPIVPGKLDLDVYGDLPLVDNIGVQTCWGRIEQEKGVYDWSGVDELIYYWTKLGKKINFRICTDNLMLPAVFNGVPNWLIDEMVATYGVEETYETYSYDYDGAIVREIKVMNLANEMYQEHFQRFMAALSERYGDNPNILTIDIRGFGCWSEWHSGYTFESIDERMETLQSIIKTYADSFASKGKILFVSCSPEYRDSENTTGYIDDGIATIVNPENYEDYLKWSGFDYAMQLNNVGYRRDGLGTSSLVPQMLDQKLMTELYRSGKLTANAGEFIGGLSEHVIDGGIYGKKGVDCIDELMFKTHANFATVPGWVNSAVATMYDEGYENILQRGADMMGYRFAIDSAVYSSKVEPNGVLKTALTISNSGVGRFYFKGYGIKYALVNGGGKEVWSEIDYSADLNNIVTGSNYTTYKNFNIPQSIEEGDYTLRISIVNSKGANTIRLATAGNYEYKFYDIGNLKIENGVIQQSFYEELTAEQLSNYTFKAGENYRVTFNYTSPITEEDYVLNSLDNGFKVDFVSKSNTQTLLKWQDVSGDQGAKTINFTPDKNGKLQILNDNFADISIVKAYVEKMPKGYAEDFEDYDISSVKNVYYTEYINGVEVTNDDKISLATADRGMNHMFVSDPKNLELKNGVTYSISFDFKATQHSATAGYQYFGVKTDDNKIDYVGEWYMRPDEPQTRMTFIFTVNGNNASLVFGMKNAGGYEIDNVSIYALSKGDSIQGVDIIDKDNNRWQPNENNLGVVENFECGNVHKTLATLGASYVGGLTYDKDKVINGNVSYRGYVPIEMYGVQDYYEIMYSNTLSYGTYEAYNLKANTTYNVQFDYKVVEIPNYNGINGHFLAFFRSRTDDTGYTFDVPIDLAFGKTANKVGQVIHFDKTVTLKNKNDYVFMLSMYMPGEIIIDNFVITEVN